MSITKTIVTVVLLGIAVFQATHAQAASDSVSGTIHCESPDGGQSVDNTFESNKQLNETLNLYINTEEFKGFDCTVEVTAKFTL